MYIVTILTEDNKQLSHCIQSMFEHFWRMIMGIMKLTISWLDAAIS